MSVSQYSATRAPVHHRSRTLSVAAGRAEANDRAAPFLGSAARDGALQIVVESGSFVGALRAAGSGGRGEGGGREGLQFTYRL